MGYSPEAQERMREKFLYMKLTSAAQYLTDAACCAAMARDGGLYWIDGVCGVRTNIKHCRDLIAAFEAELDAVLADPSVVDQPDNAESDATGHGGSPHEAEHASLNPAPQPELRGLTPFPKSTREDAT